MFLRRELSTLIVITLVEAAVVVLVCMYVIIHLHHRQLQQQLSQSSNPRDTEPDRRNTQTTNHSLPRFGSNALLFAFACFIFYFIIFVIGHITRRAYVRNSKIDYDPLPHFLSCNS